MASSDRRKPPRRERGLVRPIRRSSTRERSIRRREAWAMLVGGGALLALALALLVNVATSLRAGSFDARSKGATEPSILTAADDPFWFYGLQAIAAFLGILGLVLALQMMHEMVRELLTGAPRRR